MPGPAQCCRSKPAIVKTATAPDLSLRGPNGAVAISGRHWQPVQTAVKMANATKLVIARALRARGNLGEAVAFSPGVSCYPAGYCEIATSLRSSE